MKGCAQENTVIDYEVSLDNHIKMASGDIVIALLNCNSHSIPILLFEVRSSMVFSIFRVVQLSPNLILEHFLTPKRNPRGK